MYFLSVFFRTFIVACLSGGFLSLCVYACLKGSFPEVVFRQHKVFEESRQPVAVIEEVPETVLEKNSENPLEETKSVDALVGILGNMQKLMTGSDKLEH